MADQDFNIKVVTTADTSGIKQTSDELQKLRQQSLRDALGPVPEELLGSEPVKEIGEATKQAAVHTKDLAGGAMIAGANFTRARTEAIILVRELAIGAPTVRTLGSLLGSLGLPIAAAGIAAVALSKGFISSREEALKLIEVTEKMGEEIEATGIKQQQAIKAVTKPEDVTKVAETAVAELDKVHAKNVEIQKKELTYFQKAVEAIRESFQRGVNVVPVSEDFVKPYTATLNAIKANAQAEEDAAKANVQNAITRASKQREKVEGLEQEISSVDKLENQLRFLQAQQDSLDKSALDYGKKWIDAANNIRNVQSQLSAVLSAQTQHQKDTAKEVKDTASDMFKAPEQFNREQQKRADEHQARMQAASAELKQMEAEGGPKTESETARQEELRKFLSPESRQRFQDEQEKRQLERYQGLQEGIIDPMKSLSDSLGPEGARKYEAARQRLGQIDDRSRASDPTGGRMDAGSQAIAAKLDTLIGLWR